MSSVRSGPMIQGDCRRCGAVRWRIEGQPDAVADPFDGLDTFTDLARDGRRVADCGF